MVYKDADMDVAIPGAANGDLLQPGPVLQRRLAAVRRARRLRRGGPGDLGRGQEDQGRRGARPRHPDGPADLGGAARQGARLHGLGDRRRRPRAGRRGARRRPRLLRRADRAHRHHARHEGGARGDLRSGGVRDSLQLRGRRRHPQRQRHELRAGVGDLDAATSTRRTGPPTACTPARSGSTATTCSTPRCRSAATRSPAGAARWATTCSTNYLETKSVVIQL